MNEKVKSILNDLEQDIVDLRLAAFALIKMSLKLDPKEYVNDLPEDLLDYIMEIVAFPPNSLDDICLTMTFGFSKEATDNEKKLTFENAKLNFFAGDWRMHSYFLQNDPKGYFHKLLDEKKNKT